ncbi:CLUMA_CG007901, isoform A [Clunio marinus]|uniref:CLUMA_CG007901, isoform A n=1 Tax=Clunio marinus TaxID=568069 RepID=A0A1J1I3Q7_9DIPT|nr:CLUMA_CG007901, isoform A [Clunio marinus]
MAKAYFTCITKAQNYSNTPNYHFETEARLNFFTDLGFKALKDEMKHSLSYKTEGLQYSLSMKAIGKCSQMF